MSQTDGPRPIRDTEAIPVLVRWIIAMTINFNMFDDDWISEDPVQDLPLWLVRGTTVTQPTPKAPHVAMQTWDQEKDMSVDAKRFGPMPTIRITVTQLASHSGFVGILRALFWLGIGLVCRQMNDQDQRIRLEVTIGDPTKPIDIEKALKDPRLQFEPWRRDGAGPVVYTEWNVTRTQLWRYCIAAAGNALVNWDRKPLEDRVMLADLGDTLWSTVITYGTSASNTTVIDERKGSLPVRNEYHPADPFLAWPALVNKNTPWAYQKPTQVLEQEYAHVPHPKWYCGSEKLSLEQLRQAGFTDYGNRHLCFRKGQAFAKNKRPLSS